jgi:hypothetical protein
MTKKKQNVKQPAPIERDSRHLFWGLIFMLLASAFALYVAINIFGLNKAAVVAEISPTPSESPTPSPSPSRFGFGHGGRRPPPPPPAFMMGPGGPVLQQPGGHDPNRLNRDNDNNFGQDKKIVSESDRLPDELKNVPPESRKSLLKDVTLIITSDSIADVFLDDTRGKRFYGSTGENRDRKISGKYAIWVRIKPGNYQIELRDKNGNRRRKEITVLPLINEVVKNINMKRPEE